MGLISPTFDGSAIFGAPVTMHTTDPPREMQVNAFAGIDGVEILDLGRRMRQTHVKGRYTADSEFELGAMFSILRSYKDTPEAFPLYTTKGELFLYCKLSDVQEVPPVHVDGITGRVYQDYTCTFIHLR